MHLLIIGLYNYINLNLNKKGCVPVRILGNRNMLHSRNSRGKVHNHHSMYETSLPHIYSHNVACAYLWSWGLQFGEDAVLLIYKSLIGWETKLLQNLAILDLAAGEQRMVEVGGVCDDDAGSAVTVSVNNVMEGWKRSPCDLLCSPLCSDFFSEVLELPKQMEIQLLSTLVPR